MSIQDANSSKQYFRAELDNTESVIVGISADVVDALVTFDRAAGGMTIETTAQGPRDYYAPRTADMAWHPGPPRLSFDAGTKKIARDVGSWVDDGFISGMTIVVRGTEDNDDTFTIAGISATELTTTEDLVDEDDVVQAIVTGTIATAAGAVWTGVSGSPFSADAQVALPKGATAVRFTSSGNGNIVSLSGKEG